MNWFQFLNEQWLLISLLSVLVIAFAYLEKLRAGTTYSLHEVTRLVNAGDAVLVDLRDSKEYSAGHIVDAINIPFAKLQDRASELEKHKSKTIVLIDKMGQHAVAAAKIMGQKEFTVARMQGGMAEWQAQNLPVVKG